MRRPYEPRKLPLVILLYAFASIELTVGQRACDNFLGQDAPLASYCQCGAQLDLEPNEPRAAQHNQTATSHANSIRIGINHDDERSSDYAAIRLSQLHCWPTHLAKFVHDFRSALEQSSLNNEQASTSRPPQLKIDYLHLSTNLLEPDDVNGATATEDPGDSRHDIDIDMDNDNNRDADNEPAPDYDESLKEPTVSQGQIIINNDHHDSGAAAADGQGGDDQDESKLDDEDSGLKLTSRRRPLPVKRPPRRRVAVALIDHLAIQLSNGAAHLAANGTDSMDLKLQRQLGLQMTLLGSLINESKLQFLSIIFIPNPQQAATSSESSSSPNDAAHQKTLLDSDPITKTTTNNQHKQRAFVGWLARLTGLERLELNGFGAGTRLQLAGAKLGKKLRWLNLAKNSGIQLKQEQWAANSTKTTTNSKPQQVLLLGPNLEFLSLESCKLDQFNLLQMLQQARPVAASGMPDTDLEAPVGSRSGGSLLQNIGHTRISSLNLARNRLTSLEGHLGLQRQLHSPKDAHRSSSSWGQWDFPWPPPPPAPSSTERQPAPLCPAIGVPAYRSGQNRRRLNKEAHNSFIEARGVHYYFYYQFELTSLSQLDLSFNGIEQISREAGQLLLCFAPNLSQLYLGHNNLLQIHLDSLLWFKSQFEVRFSRLEHLDVSSNSLMALNIRHLDEDDNFYNRENQMNTHHPFGLNNNNNNNNKPLNHSQLQLKSINFAHNKLTNSINNNSSLINKLTSSLIETFAIDSSHDLNSTVNLLNLMALFELPRVSTTINSSFIFTLCDLFAGLSQATGVSSSGGGSSSDDDQTNELSLTGNQLGSLSKTDFWSPKCESLHVLKLARNQITHLDGDSLNSMSRLQFLDLSNNQLESIPERMFFQTRNLRTLNLRSNRLMSLPKRLFASLRRLEELRLDENELLQLPSDCFSQNQALIQLDLSSNRLARLDELTLANLVQLQQLKLDGNELQSFHIHRLRIAPQVTRNAELAAWSKSHEVSNSKSNAIKSKNNKQRHSFLARRTRHRFQREEPSGELLVDVDLPSENDLVLASNQLVSFGPTASSLSSSSNDCSSFLLLTRATWLNNNRLRRLNASTFSCLTNLNKLYLQHNLINSIQSETFNKLSQLEYLDLSFNQLDSLSPILIKPLRVSLRFLDLQANQLKNGSPSLNMIMSVNQSKDNDDQHELLPLESLNLSDNPRLSIGLNELSSFFQQTRNLRQLRLRNIARLGQEHQLDSMSNKQVKFLSEKLQIDYLDLGQLASMDELLMAMFSNHLVSIDHLDLSHANSNLNSSSGWSLENRLISFLSNRLQYELLGLNLTSNRAAWSALSSILQNSSSSSTSAPPNHRYQLTHLSAGENAIDSWPFDALTSRQFSNLVDLDLSQNKLQNLLLSESPSGYQFGQLQRLNLSFNMIGSLQNHNNNNSNNNKELSLSTNNGGLGLSQLSDLMPRLQFLDLSHNRLSWISKKLFHGLAELTHLRLDHNRLEMFHSSMSTGLHRSPLKLDLSFNQKLKEHEYESQNSHTRSMDLDLIHILEESSDSIIFDDGGRDTRCLEASKYIELAKQQARKNHHGRRTSYQLDNFVSRSQSFNLMDEEDEIHELSSSSMGVNCEQLIQLLDSITLDQSGSMFASIPWPNDRFLELSFEQANLRQLPTLRNENIIRLVASFNEIDHIPDSFCSLDYTPNLMSLELTNNKLNSKSQLNLSHCKRLNFLDLSFNEQLTSLENLKLADSLQVLKLRHVGLRSLSGQLAPSSLAISHSFVSQSSLRFVDLRDNKLGGERVSLKLLVNHGQVPRLSCLMDSPSQEDRGSVEATRKPLLSKVDSSSISIEMATESGSVLEIVQFVNGTVSTPIILRANQQRKPNDNDNHYELRFCTLNPEAESELCRVDTINRSEMFENSLGPEQERRSCVKLRPPKGTKSCLTNLIELDRIQQPPIRSDNLLIAGAHDTSIPTHESASIDLAQTLTNNLTDQASNQTQSPQQHDIVLRLIEQMKVAWLRVKQLDFNEHLMSLSSVQPDSVLTNWNGKPIYTLIVMKVALSACAISIVILLLCFFFLIMRKNQTNTNNSSKRRRLKDNAQSQSPVTDSQSLLVNSSTTGGGLESSSKESNKNNSSCNFSSSSFTESLQPRSSQSSSTGNTTNSNSRGGSKRRTMSQSLGDSTTGKSDEQLITQLELHNHNHNQKSVHQICSLDANQLMNQSCSTPSSSLAPSSVETAETMQAIDSIRSSNTLQATNAIQGSVDQYETLICVNPKHPIVVNQVPQVATVMRMVKSNSANTFAHSSLNGQNQHFYGSSKSHAQPQQQITNYSSLRDRRLSSKCPNPPTIYELNGPFDRVEEITSGEFNDPTTMSLQSLNSSLANSVANASQYWPPDTNLGESNYCVHHRQYQPSYVQNISSHHQATSNYQLVVNEEALTNFPPKPPSSRALEALESSQLSNSGGTIDYNKVLNNASSYYDPSLNQHQGTTTNEMSISDNNHNNIHQAQEQMNLQTTNNQQRINLYHVEDDKAKQFYYKD